MNIMYVFDVFSLFFNKLLIDIVIINDLFAHQ